MRPSLLVPGDILLYRNTNTLGKLITWGEWTNTPREGLEYNHAAVVVNPEAGLGFEMNWPASRFIYLDKEDWDVIDVYRVMPSVDQTKLLEWCKTNEGIRYPVAKLGQFLGAGLLARTGWTWAAKKVANAWDTDSPRWMVCSATVAKALEYSARGPLNWPKAADDMRPADLPLGNVCRVQA
jgi:hypothetical protein